MDIIVWYTMNMQNFTINFVVSCMSNEHKKMSTECSWFKDLIMFISSLLPDRIIWKERLNLVVDLLSGESGGTASLYNVNDRWLMLLNINVSMLIVMYYKSLSHTRTYIKTLKLENVFVVFLSLWKFLTWQFVLWHCMIVHIQRRADTFTWATCFVRVRCFEGL